MKRLIFIFYTCCFLTGAQNNTEFDKGNALYNEGNYKAAIQAYEVILEKGLHSAELYYNLANCFYKLNKVGPTIYFYEKALMLDPKDPEILNNLAFAEKMRIDKIELIPEMGLVKLIKNILDLFKLDTWAFICIVFMLTFIGFFIAYYLNQSAKKKRLFFVFGCLSALLVSACFGFVHQKNKRMESQTFGILYSQKVRVQSDPNLKSDAAFELHEGTKVQLLETFQGNWTKIKLQDGKTGWIPNNDVKAL